jgi:ribonuclease Z
MKLLLLGTSGYHPCERRHTACLMLPEAGIVLDAGTGFFRVRQHLQRPTLDILLTHAHLDHVAGLTYLLSTTFEKPLERITVHGQADKLAAVREHLLSEQIFPAALPCQWQPLRDGPSMAYVTDTTASPGADYVRQIRGVSLLVHECNFRDGQEEWAAKTGHSSTTPVAQVAAAAGAKRLVLVHFDSLDESDDPVGLATAREIFTTTDLGHDGMEVEF